MSHFQIQPIKCLAQNNDTYAATTLSIKGPSIGHYASHASAVVLVLTAARRLLLKSVILAANKSLRSFIITKMAAKRSQRAILNGQYRFFKLSS